MRSPQLIALAGASLALVVGGCESGESNAPIAFTLENGPLYTAASDGTGARALTDLPVYGTPAWSPDGTTIVFNGGEIDHGHLYTIRPDGTGRRQLTRGTANDPVDPAWASDAKHLAVGAAGKTGFDGDIAILTLSDGSVTKVTTGPADDKSPQFSSDGKRIVFLREENGPPVTDTVWVVNADGSELHRLTPTSMKASHPWWSPDGTRIVFNDGAGSVTPGSGDSHIFVMNADGTGLRRLTHGKNSADFHPSWSPDGKTIFFTRYTFAPESRLFALYRMNVDGSGVSLVYQTADGDANNVSIAPSD